MLVVLRSIVETIMNDVMFEIPSQQTERFVVTLDYAKQQMGRQMFPVCKWHNVKVFSEKIKASDEIFPEIFV